VKIAIKK